MELQAVSSQTSAVTALNGQQQQQPVRATAVNEVAQQREREDARTRLEDRVTLSPDARQATTDPRGPQPQDAVQANGNAQAIQPNQPDPATGASRAPDNTAQNEQQPRNQVQNQNQAQTLIQEQLQAGNNPQPQPASVVRALEAYNQTSLV